MKFWRCKNKRQDWTTFADADDIATEQIALCRLLDSACEIAAGHFEIQREGDLQQLQHG